MLRIPFTKSLIVSVILLSACAPEPQVTLEPEDLYIAPYLQNVTPTSITVMWETAEPTVGSVEYGQNGNFNSRSNIDLRK